MSRLIQNITKFRLLAFVMAIAFMITLTGYVNAAGNSFPSGTKGWIYYIGIDATGSYINQRFYTA